MVQLTFNANQYPPAQDTEQRKEHLPGPGEPAYDRQPVTMEGYYEACRQRREQMDHYNQRWRDAVAEFQEMKAAMALEVSLKRDDFNQSKKLPLVVCPTRDIILAGGTIPPEPRDD